MCLAAAEVYKTCLLCDVEQANLGLLPLAVASSERIQRVCTVHKGRKLHPSRYGLLPCLLALHSTVLLLTDIMMRFACMSHLTVIGASITTVYHHRHASVAVVPICAIAGTKRNIPRPSRVTHVVLPSTGRTASRTAAKHVKQPEHKTAAKPEARGTSSAAAVKARPAPQLGPTDGPAAAAAKPQERVLAKIAREPLLGVDTPDAPVAALPAAHTCVEGQYRNGDQCVPCEDYKQEDCVDCTVPAACRKHLLGMPSWV